MKHHTRSILLISSSPFTPLPYVRHEFKPLPIISSAWQTPRWFQYRSGFSILCQVGSISGSGSGFIILWLKTKKKNFRVEKVNIFMIKNCSWFFSRPPYRTSKLHEKPLALKRKPPALKTINTFQVFFFSRPFLLSWIRIHIPKNHSKNSKTTLSSPGETLPY